MAKKDSSEEKISRIRIKTTIWATITALIAAIGVSYFKENAPLILTLEVIILPAIYVIGSEYNEYNMRKVHNKLMEDLRNTINELEKKNNGLQIKLATIREER